MTITVTKELLEDKILQAGTYEKCLKCRCFRETLDTIGRELRPLSDEVSLSLLESVDWVERQLLEPEYI